MKKGPFDRTMRILNNAFNIRTWSDFDRMKAFTIYLQTGISRLFIPRKATATQSFNEALKQYQITERGLAKRQKSLLRTSILMCLLALGLFVYAIYLMTIYAWGAVLLSLTVMMMALVLAFRYHFWFFQIKRRKLGCTIQEWFRQGLLGEKIRGNDKT